MGISQIQLTSSLSWTVNKSNTGYTDTTESDTQSFNLAGLNIATYNQIVNLDYTIASGGTQSIDLTAQPNLVNESVDFTEVIAIFITNSGAPITIGPDATNGLQWFWGSGTDTTTVPDGGWLAWSTGTAGTGKATVNSTNKNLLITNTGGTATTVKISILGTA